MTPQASVGTAVADIVPPSTPIVAGTVSSLSPFRCLVAGAERDCLLVGPYRPRIGDQVAISLSQNVLRVLGWVSSVALPSTATVTAESVDGRPGFIAVTDPEGVQWQIVAAREFAAGDVVAIEWGDSLGRALTLAPAIAQPEPPPSQSGPGGGPGAQWFAPIESRSWRNGAWRDDTDSVVQGDYGGYGQNYGSWFYGGGPVQTIPADRVVVEAKLLVPRQRGGANASQTMHLYHHTSDLRSVGDVYRDAGPWDISSPPVGGAVAADIPLDLGQAVARGGGIGIAGDPYIVVGGRSADQRSGLLYLRWQ